MSVVPVLPPGADPRDPISLDEFTTELEKCNKAKAERDGEDALANDMQELAVTGAEPEPQLLPVLMLDGRTGQVNIEWVPADTVDQPPEVTKMNLELAVGLANGTMRVGVGAPGGPPPAWVMAQAGPEPEPEAEAEAPVEVEPEAE